jgi:type VI secretion system secreted protein Hcp
MAGYATGMGTHSDMFLKIDGIEGESLDDKHKNEIQLLSFSFSASQHGSAGMGGGSGTGKVQMHDFQISKHIDKASPLLFKACATGKHTPKVTLVCRKAGGTQQEFLKYTFSEVMISSVSQSGSGSETLPVEQISMNYAKFEIEYKAQDEKGGLGGVVKAGWNSNLNKEV